MTADTSRRELAQLGERLGDDGSLWRTALRALASPSGGFGSSRHIHMVAGQVHAEARSDDSTPARSQEFVEAFLDCYDLEELDDVDDLLGRESFERDNYEGQLAFVGGADA